MVPVNESRICFLIKQIIVFLVAFLFVACQSKEPPQGERTINLAPKVFKVKPVQKGYFERVPGVVLADVRSNLESKIAARVVRYFVTDGDEFSKGDPLVELDSRDILARIASARSAFQVAQAEFERYKKLLSSNAVSKQEFEHVESRFITSKGMLEEAEALLTYTKIQAPFDGVVVEKTLREGDLATPGRILLRVEKKGSYIFEANVPETSAGLIKKGEAYLIELHSFNSQIEGKVVEVSPQIDPSARAVAVKLLLPGDSKIKSGTYGHLLIPAAGSHGIFIPQKAVFRKGQLEFVYTIAQDKVSLRLIKTGRKYEDFLEVVSGLAFDDLVIIEPLTDLVEDLRVTNFILVNEH